MSSLRLTGVWLNHTQIRCISIVASQFILIHAGFSSVKHKVQVVSAV